MEENHELTGSSSATGAIDSIITMMERMLDHKRSTNGSFDRKFHCSVKNICKGAPPPMKLISPPNGYQTASYLSVAPKFA